MIVHRQVGSTLVRPTRVFSYTILIVGAAGGPGSIHGGTVNFVVVKDVNLFRCNYSCSVAGTRSAGVIEY